MEILTKPAFDELFRDHYSDLVHYAYRIFRDQSRSEDVVQDLFLDLWKKKAQLTGINSYSAYLKRATQNKCYDQLRKDKRRPILESEDRIDTNQKVSLSIEDELISEEKVQHIKNVVNSLPDKGRTVFMMSRFEGMSYKDIAESLEVSTKTVEYHMMQNLKFLRQALFFFVMWMFF